MLRILLVLQITLVLFYPLPVFGQTISAKEAEKLFKEKQYCRALEYYAKSLSAGAEDRFKRALCLYHCHQLSTAEQELQALVRDTKNAEAEWHYWLAMVYQHQQKFEQARREFKTYLHKAGTKGSYAEAAMHQVQRCIDAEFLMRREPWGYLEQLNDKVNSAAHELMPLFSPNFDDRIYFTSNVGGPYQVYGAEVGQGIWNPRYLLREPGKPGAQITLLDFNENGQVAFYLEENYGSIRFLADTFESSEAVRTGQYKGPLSERHADHYSQFLFDSVVVFASNRQGGFGGYDLYVSVASQGQWGPPMNLGQEVNSPADELSPFFTNDGRELYFSSNRLEENMGGFDIYRIKLDEKSKQWGELYNLGPPVNSPGDDLGLQISSNGRNAMFTSNRKSGLGGYDVYYFFIKQPIVSQFFEYGGLPAVIEKLQNSFVQTNLPVKQNVPLPYLLYSEDDNIIIPENLNKLEQLSQKLKDHPNGRLDIIVHADNSSGLRHLFFCAKRAEKVLDYLQPKLNLSLPIFILGAGAEYPLAKNEINLAPLPAGQRLNRRIEFNLHDQNIIGEQDLPKVSAALADSAYALFKAFKSGLWFKVFVLSATRPVDLPVLGEYPEVTVERFSDKSNYDYTVGRYATYAEADQVKLAIRGQGFYDATVYAYIDGRRITEEEANALVKDFPELMQFKARKE